MPSLDTLISSKPLPTKTLIYGDPKTGKSRAIGRLAKYRKLVYFDNEKSARTFQSADNLAPDYRKNINLFTLPDTKTFPISAVTMRKVMSMPWNTEFNFCNEHTNHNCVKCKSAGKPFTKFSVQKDIIDADGILVLDSLLQLTTSYIEFIRADANKNLVSNLSVLSLDSPTSFKQLKDDEKLDWDDWNHLGNLCFELVNAIQAAPFDIICTTGVVMVPHEDGKNRMTPAMGSDKFAPKIAHKFDNVIFCEVSLGKYNYHTAPSMAINAVCGSRDAVDLNKMKQDQMYSILEPFYRRD